MLKSLLEALSPARRERRLASEAKHQEDLAREQAKKLAWEREGIVAFLQRYRTEYETYPTLAKDYVKRPLGDDELGALDLAALKKYEDDVKLARDQAERFRKELAFKADAVDPNHVYSIGKNGPHGALTYTLTRPGSTIKQERRYALALINILNVWGYVNDEDWEQSWLLLLGDKSEKVFKGNRLSPAGVKDEQFLLMWGLPRHEHFVVVHAKKWFNEAYDKNPQSARLNRLKKDFKKLGFFE